MERWEWGMERWEWGTERFEWGMERSESVTAEASWKQAVWAETGLTPVMA
jgi:hypothetical protein